MSGGKGFTTRDVWLDGNGSGGGQREWVVFGALFALDAGKPMVTHCRGGIEFHRECVRLLVDILGMNHVNLTVI